MRGEPCGAVITGADSGIGRAIAVALADDGFDVGITWFSDQDGACETARRINAVGRRAEVEWLDLAAPAEAARSVQSLAARLGGLAAFVNNAAIPHESRVVDQALEDWANVIAIDLTGQFACAQAAARLMVQKGNGRIVNVTSAQEHAPLLGGAAYCAAKAGLGMLTKVMALELAPHGVTVNSVAPGHIATAMSGYSGDPEHVDDRFAALPVGQIGMPTDVAAAVSYLCSPRASATTGISLPVDGGLLLYSCIPLQHEVGMARETNPESAAAERQ
jgi:NAD(P)-dependent dehydrogenase (short-subunit alcohol dehydrogenase family)